MEYVIQYVKTADKYLCKHEDLRTHFETAIRAKMCGENLEQIDIKEIKGKRNSYYRMRIGKYRIVYAIINGKLIVVRVLLAGPCGDVYNGLAGLD
ncbi:MAG: type II toxin-antitoxin system RelE/ParE family toxin [Clostridiales bacterium]|nr:type II toxin-antitoxin system RelE/ParE family toxin [Clostridiales bacterium]